MVELEQLELDLGIRKKKKKKKEDIKKIKRKRQIIAVARLLNEVSQRYEISLKKE